MTRRFIRQTLTGKEYWDTKAKKTVFVSNQSETEKQAIDEPEKTADIADMTVDELISFAKENGVAVPGTMKKEETIRKFIADALEVDA